jgi:environmental stress-induced protein Ves
LKLEVMKIIRSRDCRAMPWKNGGGSTTEIAAHPTGASLDHFDWRISMATVASDGPFSSFAGIDRTLAVTSGHGVVLTVGAGEPIIMAPGAAPARFAGDVPTSARLISGAITDLNVMTRRGRFSHRLIHVKHTTSYDCSGAADVALVLSLDGRTAVSSGDDEALLAHGDSVIIDQAHITGFEINPGTALCYLITLQAT